MGAQDENNRGNVREKNRLRSTVAQEPSGSYSYHDEARAEAVNATRTTGAPRAAPANDAKASQRPGSRFAKSTMVGGFSAPPPERAKDLLSPTITQSDKPQAKSAKALSEPPEIGSWPPLPNVPKELEGRAEVAHAVGAIGAGSERPFSPDDEDDLAPTDPPKASKAATAIGGAIWEAVGPMVSNAPVGNDLSSQRSEPPSSELAPSAKEPKSPNVLGAAKAIEGHATADADVSANDAVLHAHASAPKKKEPHALIGDVMSAANAVYRDHDLEKWEQLVERGAWEQLVHDLEKAPRRSPAVHLLHVIARRETLPADDKGAGKLTQEAIHALADVLGVPASSPTALMLAKRLLRRNPVWTATQPAAGISISIVLGGLAAGAGIGWLVTKLLL